MLLLSGVIFKQKLIAVKLEFSKEDMILKVFPTISGCFEEGWYSMKKHFWWLLLGVVLVALVESPTEIFQKGFEEGGIYVIALGVVRFFQFIIWILIVGPLSYGVDWMFLKASRKQNVEREDLFSGFRNYVRVIFARLLVTILVGVGFLCLVIPGIFLLCKLIFVPYIIMDKKVDPVEAISLSWKLSSGYFWTIFGMGIVSFFILILGVIALGLGVFVSMVWIRSSFATLYKAVEELHYKEIKK